MQSVVAPLATICHRLLIITVKIYNIYRMYLFSYAHKKQAQICAKQALKEDLDMTFIRRGGNML
jgi:hypothetical protein